MLVVVDPGHGGTVPAGSSTPYGGAAASGTPEKVVTLEVARRLVDALGARRIGARLTRADDANLTLADRAARARAEGADVFVSLHACRGGGPPGAEVWVHPAAGAASRGLAEEVHQALGGVGPVLGVRTGPMAVLDPAHHDPSTAGCLVELDDLATSEGARRLLDPYEQGRLAQALSDGIGRFLGRSAYGNAERDWARANPAGRIDRRRGASGEVTNLILWNFGVDSADLKSEHQTELFDLVRRMEGRNDIDLDVVGYTSSSGETADNRALSLRRARAVRDYLTSHGYLGTIHVDGVGADNPWMPNDTGEHMAMNRRVEIGIARMAFRRPPVQAPTAPSTSFVLVPTTASRPPQAGSVFPGPRDPRVHGPIAGDPSRYANLGRVSVSAAGTYLIEGSGGTPLHGQEGILVRIVPPRFGSGGVQVQLQSTHGPHTSVDHVGAGTAGLEYVFARPGNGPTDWRIVVFVDAVPSNPFEIEVELAH